MYVFVHDTAATEIYTLSLHDALPIFRSKSRCGGRSSLTPDRFAEKSEADISWRERRKTIRRQGRSEEHTSELQSRLHLVCRLLLEKKKPQNTPSVDADVARTRRQIDY